MTSGTRPRSAKKVTDIFLFILTNDPVRLDHSAYDIYNDQQDPSLLIFKIGILYILIRLYRLDDD